MTAVVVTNTIRTRTNEMTNPVQTIIKLLRPKHGQIRLLGPFLPHVILRPQRDTPIDSPTATPATSRKDTHSAIVGHNGVVIVVEMLNSRALGHGELRGREVVALVNNQDAVTCFGEVLCGHAAAWTGADDYHVCFDDVGSTGWFELNELVGIAFDALPVGWGVGVARQGKEGGAGDGCAFESEVACCFGEGPEKREAGLTPRLDDGVADITGLLADGCPVACKEKTPKMCAAIVSSYALRSM